MNVNTNYSNYSNFQKQNEADDIQAQAKIAAEELEKIQKDPNLNPKDMLDQIEEMKKVKKDPNLNPKDMWDKINVKINVRIKELEDKIASESNPELKATCEGTLSIYNSLKEEVEKALKEELEKAQEKAINKKQPSVRSIFDPNFNR